MPRHEASGLQGARGGNRVRRQVSPEPTFVSRIQAIAQKALRLPKLRVVSLVNRAFTFWAATLVYSLDSSVVGQFETSGHLRLPLRASAGLTGTARSSWRYNRLRCERSKLRCTLRANEPGSVVTDVCMA